MKIVLVGHVCIDHNRSEQSSYTGWGSPLMYMEHYLQTQLGISPVLVAPYGHDFRQYVSHIHLIPPPAGEHTLLYKNMTHHGQRTQRCDYVKFAGPVPLTKEISSNIAQADIIVLAPLLPNYTVDYVRQLLAVKKPGSLTVLLPQGYFRTVGPEGVVSPRAFTEATKLLPLFDVVILSDDDIPGDSLEVSRGWARHNSSTNIVMTQGPRGASLITSSGPVAMKVKAVAEDQIVDSVGCGDVFSAAAVHSYFRQRDIMIAIKAGNTAARAKLFQARPAMDHEPARD